MLTGARLLFVVRLVNFRLTLLPPNELGAYWLDGALLAERRVLPGGFAFDLAHAATRSGVPILLPIVGKGGSTSSVYESR